MSLRTVCQHLRDSCGFDVLSDQVLQLLRSLARPLPERDAQGRREFLQIRLMRREVLRIKLLKPWGALETLAQRRRTVAQLLLQEVLKRVPDSVRGANVPVSVRMGELADALLQDLTLAAEWKGDVDRELAAVNAGLLFLHDNGVLVLDKGKAIFRAAMTIHLNTDSKGRGFRDNDYAPLRAHYQDRTLQIHVMHEYARLGLAKMADALAFVLSYFSLPRLEFIRRYFANRKEELERAATQESYQAIVSDLGNPEQAALVCAPDNRNLLILAGPGSGKTRVIVHRVAYLARIKGELPERILVLAYNRAAAEEIRQRLLGLLGRQAWGITVLTYHALALRLTGRSLVGLTDKSGDDLFKRVLDDAIALLTGRHQPPGLDDGDSLREQLLGGYRYILVDEYQDIDQQQYELISALAGRTLEADAQLTLMAVGDDDQNIYAFRATSNEFIQRFTQDYNAQVAYLIHNYRSTHHIIDVANALIAPNPERMKTTHPVQIDRARKKHPGGGRWQTLDPLTQGKVQLLSVGATPLEQAQAMVAEIRRRRERDATLDWGDLAILAHTHAQLEPFLAWCESEGIPYQKRGQATNGQPALHQVREGKALIDQLKATSGPVVLTELASETGEQSGASPDNDWLALCAQFCREQQRLWGDEPLPASTLLDAFYEFSREARRDKRGALTLSTVHQAKGGEWSQVFVLDGGDWSRSTPDERRLYYVAMTRAAEWLTLCWSQAGRNAFLEPLRHHPATVLLDATRQPDAPAVWRRRFVTIGLDGVYLSFAGRKPASHAVHAALARLPHGAHLQLKQVGDRWQLQDKHGMVLITLAKQFEMPAGDILEVSLDSMVWRSREQGDEGYQSPIVCEGWWVPLPRVVLQPPA